MKRKDSSIDHKIQKECEEIIIYGHDKCITKSLLENYK